MDAKTKAEELYDKFLQYTPVEFEHEYAIKCALICVDEMIQEYETLTDDKSSWEGYKYKPLERISFFKKVKQEIEKL